MEVVHFHSKLSKKRATIVGDYLSAHGVDPKKMVVIGYGEERPLIPETGDGLAARKKNRRVEVILYPQEQ